MRMHLIPAGRLRMRRSIFEPGAPREATIELPVSCGLLRHAQGNLLFDTGCHPDVAHDAAGRWGGLAKVMTPIHAAQDNAVDQLACIGVQPADIDVVVCSHLHPDHCGCTTLFPRATVICHAAELQAAQAANAVDIGYLAREWDNGRAMHLITGPHDVFGDGRVVLLPMPGHTPGMVCAHVTLDRDGAFLLASDAVSVKASLDRDYVPRNTWNVEAAMASLAEIRRLEAAGVTVLCGHDAAQWDGVRKGAAFYE